VLALALEAYPTVRRPEHIGRESSAHSRRRHDVGLCQPVCLAVDSPPPNGQLRRLGSGMPARAADSDVGPSFSVGAWAVHNRVRRRALDMLCCEWTRGQGKRYRCARKAKSPLTYQAPPRPPTVIEVTKRLSYLISTTVAHISLRHNTQKLW